MQQSARYRFDPPVLKYQILAPRDVQSKDIPAFLRDFAGLENDILEQAVYHGGLYVDKKRYFVWPQSISLQQLITLYVFARMPLGIQISEKDIIYMDDDLVAINKPAWLTMQGSRASYRLSLEAQTRDLVNCDKLIAVHRLDRQTSGVALFAKHADAARAMNRQFLQHTTVKHYLAFCEGVPKQEQWKIEGWLQRAFHPRHSFFAYSPTQPLTGDAKHSLTHCALVEQYQNACLLRLRPITGRTHQIRIHLAAADLPIIGDALYGSWHDNDNVCTCHPDTCLDMRVQLHAESLQIKKPKSQEVLELIAPWPQDFGERLLTMR